MNHAIDRRVGSAMLAIAMICLTLPAMVRSSPRAPAHSAFARTMEADLQHRDPNIHWPEGFRPETADLFSHNEVTIHASCRDVWAHIVDANRWPQWYANAKDVDIAGGATALGPDSVFRWTTFGLPLESRVNEFVPYSRIGWYGYAPGTAPDSGHSFYHTWYLVPTRDACRVVTDEVGRGPDAARLRETNESLMHRGHDLWLATLKWVSETD
jgi:uncharacterized protein YndB with AHSA1/START domain